jgi:SAM-dependent methyltransferase
MQNPPSLFDPDVLCLRRERARSSEASVWFLHQQAARQVSERLQEVNRTFTDPVIVGWKGDLWRKETGLAARCVPDADVLDLQDNSCDLIVHALTLHWSNDPVGQLVQMRRALRPDGLMLAVLFGGQTLSELRMSLAQAEANIEGGLSPRVAPMGELRDLGSLLQRAGYALPVADSVKLQVTYETALHLMKDLQAMAETNVMTERRKTPFRRETLACAIDHYATHFPASGGRVAATFELIFLTGWAPSDQQQKPLRPGSAQTRLADALGTKEFDPEI